MSGFFFAWASWAEPFQDFYFALRNKNPDMAKNEFPDTGCPGAEPDSSVDPW